MNLIHRATLAAGLGVGLAVLTTATASADADKDLLGSGSLDSSPCHCDGNGTIVNLNNLGQVGVAAAVGETAEVAVVHVDATAQAVATAGTTAAGGTEAAVNTMLNTYGYAATNGVVNAHTAAGIAAQTAGQVVSDLDVTADAGNS